MYLGVKCFDYYTGLKYEEKKLIAIHLSFIEADIWAYLLMLPGYYSISFSTSYCTQFGFFIPYLSQEEKEDQWFCKKPLFCISVALSGRELCNIFPKSFSFRYFSHPYGNLLFWKIMVYLACEACQEWMYTGYWCTIHAFIPCAYIIVWWASTAFAITVFMPMLRWPSLLFWSWHNLVKTEITHLTEIFCLIILLCRGS